MTDKLHCPFCGAELIKINADLTCLNCQCRGWEIYLSAEMWQALIDGKKAQRQLKTVKDRCVKKLKAKEREIASYLNGISVRQSENEKLAKQLKQAQDALKVATDCIENIGNTWRGDQRWANDDMDEIRINIENYCDGTLQKIKELKK